MRTNQLLESFSVPEAYHIRRGEERRGTLEKIV
jgi:hypothetical protein